MTASPRFGFTLLEEAQSSGETTANESLLRLESITNAKVISDAIATPPVSPSDGDVYIVAASPTGAWTGKAGKLAWYHAGWKYIDPVGGMVVFNVTKKCWYGYSSVESAWHPQFEFWSTTEHWTGLYRDGAKVYRKVVDMNAGGALGPNTGVVTKAHGLSGVDWSKPVHIMGSAYLGGTAIPIPTFMEFISGYIMNVGIDTTNLIWEATFNASTATMKVQLEYCK